METRKLSSDIVLFPRKTKKGNTPTAIEQDMFVAEQRDIKGKCVWIITQRDFPHVASQVVETQNEEEFDLFLGRSMANLIHAEYVEGCTDFFLLISGWTGNIKWEQATCDAQMKEIYTIEAKAAIWWYNYRHLYIK